MSMFLSTNSEQQLRNGPACSAGVELFPQGHRPEVLRAWKRRKNTGLLQTRGDTELVMTCQAWKPLGKEWEDATEPPILSRGFPKPENTFLVWFGFSMCVHVCRGQRKMLGDIHRSAMGQDLSLA